MSRIEELKTKDGEDIYPVTYYNCVKSNTSVDAKLLSQDIEDIKNGVLGNMKSDESGDCDLVSIKSGRTLVYGGRKISSLLFNDSKITYDFGSDTLELMPYANRILDNAVSFPKRIALNIDNNHTYSSRIGFCCHFIPKTDISAMKSKILYSVLDLDSMQDIYPEVLINDDCILSSDSQEEIYVFKSKSGYRFDFDLSIDSSYGDGCLFINVCKFTTIEAPVSLANPNGSEE